MDQLDDPNWCGRGVDQPNKSEQKRMAKESWRRDEGK